MVPIAVLCGGLGTRLLPLTADRPKAMVPVLGRPFIDHLLTLLARKGFADVVLLVGHFGRAIEEHVADGARFGLNVTYAYDGATQRGTAGAIKDALPFLGETFFVTFGDSYLDCDYVAIERTFESSAAIGLMTVFRNRGELAPSNVLMRDGAIVAYDKTTSDPAFEYIDYGVSAYRARAFDGLDENHAVDLTAVNRRLLDVRALQAYEIPTRFFEVGSFSGIAELEAFLAREA